MYLLREYEACRYSIVCRCWVAVMAVVLTVRRMYAMEAFYLNATMQGARIRYWPRLPKDREAARQSIGRECTFCLIYHTLDEALGQTWNELRGQLVSLKKKKTENGALSRPTPSLLEARCISPKPLVRIGIVGAAATTKAVLGRPATAATKIPSQIQSRGRAVAQRNIPAVLLFLGLAIRGAPWLIAPNATLPNAVRTSDTIPGQATTGLDCE